MTEHSEHFKRAMDWLSAFTAVGALTSFLPQVAAIFTIIWYGIRIWESETVRNLTGRTKSKEQWIDTATFRRYREDKKDIDHG
jgi:hypothetical protein